MIRNRTPLTAICAAILCASAASISAHAEGGLQTINNPGGGQIVFGPLGLQATLPNALGIVLREVHKHFGDRPQIGKLFRPKNSDSIATFFTLTANSEGGKKIAGLIIVSLPQGAQPVAAMLYDDSDRFSKTIYPMMQTLNEAWDPSVGQSTATSGSSRGASGASSGVGEAQPLNETPFPDNTGSIGLPAGWHTTFAGRGGVHAVGPNGEKVDLGMMISGIADTNNPRAMQSLQYAVRTGKPAFAAPYGGDLVSAFKAISQQSHQRDHTPVPTLTVTSVNPVQNHPYTTAEVMVMGEMDCHDGKGLQIVSMSVASQRPGALGLWTLCINAVSVPKNLAASEWNTMRAIFGSWRQNGAQIQHNTAVEIGRIKAEGELVDRRIAASHAANDAHNKMIEQHWDNIDKYSKSFQNYTFDKSELQDNDTHERGAVDYATADALVKSDPNRYQYVPTPDFLKGVDY